MQWPIQGDSGKSYMLTYEHGAWSCTCLGFNYHQHCKHIDRAKSGYYGMGLLTAIAGR